MPPMPDHREESHQRAVASLYDRFAGNGPYGTLAPENEGGLKSRYVAEVFDAALLPELLAAPPRSLLDVGCGTGIFSVRAIEHAGLVAGVDVSAQMLRIACDLAGGTPSLGFFQADGTRLPFRDSSFDCVVARESLCYVPDASLPGVLDDIFRVLSPGGRFLWLEQMSDNPAYQVHPAAPLLKKRSPAALRSAATAAGFACEELRVVRRPRFPWIYLIWAGLVPARWVPALARWETRWHRRIARPRSRRWFDGMLVLRRPPA
jgi:ubiquinone/menaquinone biosynthesis C-methylase UbiE